MQNKARSVLIIIIDPLMKAGGLRWVGSGRGSKHNAELVKDFVKKRKTPWTLVIEKMII